MTHISNGLSPAGKRIHEAGLRHQRINELERQRVERRVQKALDQFKTPVIRAAEIAGPFALRTIIKEEAGKHGLTYDDLISDARQRRLAKVRHEAMYRCAMETPHTLAQIGRAFRRDHTTVIWGIRRHCKVNDLPLPRGMTWGKK